MRLVRSKDSAAELVVRSLVWNMGYRFRLHRRDLPGSPDLALFGCRVAVFVHGCFWHRHDCHAGQRLPRTRQEFWRRKFEGNVRRDRAARLALRRAGWRVLVVWECQTTPTRRGRLARRLQRVLGAESDRAQRDAATNSRRPLERRRSLQTSAPGGQAPRQGNP